MAREGFFVAFAYLAWKIPSKPFLSQTKEMETRKEKNLILWMMSIAFYTPHITYLLNKKSKYLVDGLKSYSYISILTY